MGLVSNGYGIKARKQRWCNFLLNDVYPPDDVHSLNGDAGHIFAIDYEPDKEPPPLPWREHAQARIAWAWRKYERHIARLAWLRDDSLPYLDVYTGTEIFAEAFGCPVHFPNDNNPFALPLIHSAAEVAALDVPEVSTSSVAYLFDIADELVRRAGPGALVKLVDVQSPMDIAALIWEKTSFYPALIETPDAVLELADKVKQFLVAFLDVWFARYGKAFIAHYPAYYMPEGITLSEDEVGAVSVELFETLFLPELAELSLRYGGIGVHCCAHARHQWPGFKRIPALRLLNLVQPVEVLQEAYAYFAAIPQMHVWCGAGDPWTWPAHYPEGARVVIQATATNRDEALMLADKLWATLGRG
jgi:hypothetical protein